MSWLELHELALPTHGDPSKFLPTHAALKDLELGTSGRRIDKKFGAERRLAENFVVHRSLKTPANTTFCVPTLKSLTTFSERLSVKSTSVTHRK